MKVNKEKLINIIKEELFYREFYSDGNLLGEQANIISPRVQGIAKQIEKLLPEEQMQLFNILRPMMPPPGM
jgi:hypothetical protein